jgi:hypothetical protein
MKGQEQGQRRLLDGIYGIDRMEGQRLWGLGFDPCDPRDPVQKRVSGFRSFNPVNPVDPVQKEKDSDVGFRREALNAF